MFNICFAAVISVAYTRFKLDKHITGVLMLLKKTKGAGERGKAIKAEQVLEASL